MSFKELCSFWSPDKLAGRLADLSVEVAVVEAAGGVVWTSVPLKEPLPPKLAAPEIASAFPETMPVLPAGVWGKSMGI